MRVFITGATGFLGTNLVHLLLQQDIEVHAIKRASSNIKAFEGMSVNWYEADVLNLESLQAACPDAVDVIFHIAADTSMWAVKNKQQTEINLTGTANMIRIAKDKQAKRFIHTSSIAAYGIHHDHIITEQTEQIGDQCFANYYRTKLASEKLVKAAVDEGELDAVILNPCHLVGPWDYHNWSQMLTMISRDSLPGVPPGYGSFCHIQEVAKAHLQAAKVGRTGENYILSGADASFVEFVTVIGRMLGKKVPEKPMPHWLLKVVGHVSAFVSKFTGKEPNMTPEKVLIVSEVLKVCSEKAQKELNYHVDIPLETMVSDCYQWMQHQEMIA
ncbi:MAG: SDR family oxidoreductase [Kangiellaceae bacterium]|nr:SDR family oxidoreductase [Kangiellaceae bacterium]